jgi:hypothetical protein
MAIAGAQGDIEAGCDRVTSPVLKRAERGLHNSTNETTNQGRGEERKNTLVWSQYLSRGIVG